MLDTKEHIQALLTRYIAGELSDPEREQLWRSLDQPENERTWKEIIQELSEAASVRDGYQEGEWEEMIQAIVKTPKKEPRYTASLEEIVESRPIRRLSWLAAASIAGLLLIGGYWGLTRWQKHEKPGINNPPTATHDVLPGSNKAILTLSGGRQIILDSAANGNLAQQGNAQIQKLASGRLAYHVSSPTNGQTKTQNSEFKIYNTLSTPRGGQYQLTLPDGTKVWLNAASSIMYPVAFTGAERKVTITGEAYLEVFKDVLKPFKINIRDRAEVEVLGTSFNINAYEDERDIKTTLLEGAVRVAVATSHPIVGVNTANNKLSVVLKPGQQAQVVGVNKGNGGDQIKVLPDADVAQALAWKNGLFAFTDADLVTVMRQLARWYNIDVVYEGNIPSQQFNGKIGKTLTLSQVLDVLAKSSVRYTIEPGNKLTIRRP